MMRVDRSLETDFGRKEVTALTGWKELKVAFEDASLCIYTCLLNIGGDM
jgi:hypothetical protein